MLLLANCSPDSWGLDSLNIMFCAVIVAAGSSRRAGFDKLAAPLAGVPVLRRSVDAFVAAGCAAVVVVCPESRWLEVGLADAVFPIPVLRVDGGAERQNSVEAGLNALPQGTRYVAVHDGARPLITPQGICACLAAAQQTGAAACAHPIVDTLKRADEVSAVEALGIATRLVQVGPNLKITLPGDLELAELIWQHRA